VLEADRAPGAASMFAGFATGTAEWLDPSGERVKRPLYLDLAFHRAIEGVLVQTGCPRGDGTGHPGYRIALELHPSDEARLREPGALVMATYTPPPGRDDPAPPPPDHVIGSQFGILLGDSRHLAGDVTVLGRCADLDVVRRIAATDAARRPRLVSVAVADRAPR
jgi:peptidyl-prolyl cis-trans isomerase A (cyclophilin A)